jgi:hypothetical protein
MHVVKVEFAGNYVVMPYAIFRTFISGSDGFGAVSFVSEAVLDTILKFFSCWSSSSLHSSVIRDYTRLGFVFLGEYSGATSSYFRMGQFLRLLASSLYPSLGLLGCANVRSREYVCDREKAMYSNLLTLQLVSASHPAILHYIVVYIPWFGLI